jgi:outer membrane biosynthesis protein TonB
MRWLAILPSTLVICAAQQPPSTAQSIPFPIQVPPGTPVRFGGGVTAPRLISKVEPGYTEEARQAKLQGQVVLFVVINPDGTASDFRVIKSLGLGLAARV